MKAIPSSLKSEEESKCIFLLFPFFVFVLFPRFVLNSRLLCGFNTTWSSARSAAPSHARPAVPKPCPLHTHTHTHTRKTSHQSRKSHSFPKPLESLIRVAQYFTLPPPLDTPLCSVRGPAPQFGNLCSRSHGTCCCCCCNAELIKMYYNVWRLGFQ